MKPIPVKLDGELLKRIEEMSDRMGEHRSTVMRMAMRIGLEALEKSFEEAKSKITYGERGGSNGGSLNDKNKK